MLRKEGEDSFVRRTERYVAAKLPEPDAAQRPDPAPSSEAYRKVRRTKAPGV